LRSFERAGSDAVLNAVADGAVMSVVNWAETLSKIAGDGDDPRAVATAFDAMLIREPGSVWRSAISAEASRIDAGSASGTARAGVGLGLSPRGRSPLGDQLVGERAGRIPAEQPA